MARWIKQTLDLDDQTQIVLDEEEVYIGHPEMGGALFRPLTSNDAARMAIGLRQAAKRMEEIGKGLQ